MMNNTPNITKHFLTGQALLDYARKECGLPPVEEEKEYRDYVIATRLRQTKSEGLKRLLKKVS